MKYILTILLAVALTGCATDVIYGVGKTVYIGGKKVVVQNWSELSPEVQAKLQEVDKYATKYDEGRETLKEALGASTDTGGSFVGGNHGTK